MEDFWLDLVLRVGFPVTVVFAMVKGYLVPGFIYTRVVAENERLTRASEEKVIPLAVEGQRLLREALSLLESYEERDREYRFERGQAEQRVKHPPAGPSS